MSDLEQFVQSVEAEARDLGLEVIPALVSPGQGQATVIWTQPGDSHGFLVHAKAHGAGEILVGKEFAERDSGREVAQVLVCWIGKAAVFLLVQQADWYEDGEQEIGPAYQVRSPGELTERDETKLIEELTAFAEGRQGEFDSPYGLRSVFWESKGIHSRFRADAETRVLMQKVEVAVERLIYDREKERLPGLVTSCAEWAREQGRKTVTKGNVEYFLQDRGISLSRASRDALYNETNFALGRETKAKKS